MKKIGTKANRMKTLYLVSDFETTVDEDRENQTHSEVWAAGTCTLGMFDGTVFNSIDKWFNNLLSYRSNIICFFHNLKFDGSFIVDYFHKKGFKDAYKPISDIYGSMPKKDNIENFIIPIQYQQTVNGIA